MKMAPIKVCSMCGSRRVKREPREFGLRGGRSAVVPADVCHSCGETFIDPHAALELDRAAHAPKRSARRNGTTTKPTQYAVLCLRFFRFVRSAATASKDFRRGIAVRSAVLNMMSKLRCGNHGSSVLCIGPSSRQLWPEGKSFLMQSSL